MSMNVREGQRTDWDRVDVTQMDTYPDDGALLAAGTAVEVVCDIAPTPCSPMPDLQNPRRDELTAERMWASRND